jgi:FkbM family methyltransferase
LVRGTNLSDAIYSKRMEEWRRVRTRYMDRPKRTLGFDIYLNPDDMSPISSSIATTGWLELPRTELIKKLVRPGMTVVDVGANIGYYTLLSAKIVGESGLVLAFEPEPRNFALLRRSVEINSFSNVRMYQQILCDKEGMVTLYLSDPTSPDAHSITQRDGRHGLEVSSITLDALSASLNNRKIDFMKIHVGAEPMILRGAKRLLVEQRPTIMMAFIRELWQHERELLDQLYDQYEIYEVTRSPFLRKRIEKARLLKKEHTEVLMVEQ